MSVIVKKARGSVSEPTVKQPRRASRRQLRLPCQVVRERDFLLVSNLALDLSTEGMLVSTDHAVLTGEELLVSFRAPHGGAWFDVQATVVRVVPGKRGYCLGLAFHGVDAAAQSMLFRHLRGLPVPAADVAPVEPARARLAS